MASNQNLQITLRVNAQTGQVDAVRSSFDDLDRQVGETNNTLSQAKSIFLGLASAFGVQKIIEYADAFTSLETKIKLVTNSTEEMKALQYELLQISNDARVSLTSTADLYNKIASSSKNLGYTYNELLGVTKSISQSLAISGSSATSADAALMQLGQGLASGTLRGEELNSVMEQTPRLAEAIADGMGIGMGELRKVAADGMITSKVVIEAIRSQATALDDEFKNVSMTVAQATTVAENNFMTLVGGIDEATGASASLASSMADTSTFLVAHADEIAQGFAGIKLVFQVLKQDFYQMVVWIDGGIQSIGQGWNNLTAGMQNVWKSSADGISGIYYDMVNHVLELVSSSINTMSDALGWAFKFVGRDNPFSKVDFSIGEHSSSIKEAKAEVFELAGTDWAKTKLTQSASSVLDTYKQLQEGVKVLNVENKKVLDSKVKGAKKESALNTESKNSIKEKSKALKDAKKQADEYAKGLENAQDRLFSATHTDREVAIKKLEQDLQGLGKYLSDAELSTIYAAEMKNMQDSTQSSFKGFDNFISDALRGGNIKSSLQGLLSSLGNDLMQPISQNLSSMISSAFEPLYDNLKGMFSSLFEGGGFLDGLMSDMFGSIEGSIGTMAGMAGGTMLGGGGTGASVGASLGTMAGTALIPIPGIGGAVGGMLGGLLGGLFDSGDDEKKKAKEQERKRLLEEQAKTLETVNNQLSGFNISLNDTAYSSALADAVGGIDNLSSGMETFKNTFFTEGEQQEMVKSQLDLALAQHGVTLGSKEQIKALTIETQSKILALQARIQILKAEILGESGGAKARAQSIKMKLEAERILAQGDVASANQRINANNQVVQSSAEGSRAAIGFGRAMHGSIQEMVGQASDTLANANITDTIDTADITSPQIQALESQLSSAQGLYGTLMSNMGNFSEYFGSAGASASSAGSAAQSATEKIDDFTKSLIEIANLKATWGGDDVAGAKLKLDAIRNSTGLANLTYENFLSQFTTLTADGKGLEAETMSNWTSMSGALRELHDAQEKALATTIKTRQSAMSLLGSWTNESDMDKAKRELADAYELTELPKVSFDGFADSFKEAFDKGLDEDELKKWQDLSTALKKVHDTESARIKDLAKDLFDLQNTAINKVLNFGTTSIEKSFASLTTYINNQDYKSATDAFNRVVTQAEENSRLTYKEKLFTIADATNLINKVEKKNPNSEVVKGLELLRKEAKTTNDRLEKIENNTHKTKQNTDNEYLKVIGA